MASAFTRSSEPDGWSSGAAGERAPGDQALEGPDDDVELGAGGTAEAEHVEAAVDQPFALVQDDGYGGSAECRRVGRAVVPERVVLGDGDDGGRKAGEVGAQDGRDGGVGWVGAGRQVVGNAPAQVLTRDVVAVRVTAQRRIAVVSVDVEIEDGVDQDLRGESGSIVLHLLGDGGGEVPAGAVAAHR